jgi:hypothetical protein
LPEAFQIVTELANRERKAHGETDEDILAHSNKNAETSSVMTMPLVTNFNIPEGAQ